MSFGRPTGAMAAVCGGAVTRERLTASSAREGRSASALVQSLLAQSLPAIADLAQAYGSGLPRLDPSFLRLTPKAVRLLDPALLRRERCVPLEILEDLCILAVTPGRAVQAVEAVRAALGRDVLPVLGESPAIDRVLADLVPAPKAVRQGPLPRNDAPVHARFRDLVLDRIALDAIPVREAKA